MAWVRGFDRRTTSHCQHSYRLDRTVPAFGHCGGLPTQSGPGRCLGVGDIGLAEAAAELAVCTVYFHHLLDTDLGQITGQTGAVAAGALHPTPTTRP